VKLCLVLLLLVLVACTVGSTAPSNVNRPYSALQGPHPQESFKPKHPDLLDFFGGEQRSPEYPGLLQRFMDTALQMKIGCGLHQGSSFLQVATSDESDASPQAYGSTE
jgi:hypothetical protein